MTATTQELILAAARRAAQAHGYAGLNFRDLAKEVGIKAASIYYHFPGKADLGAAVARRYREDATAFLAALSDKIADPIERLRHYPTIFQAALQDECRMCLASFMAAEFDSLPDIVKLEITAFSDANIAWIDEQLTEACVYGVAMDEGRARAIFAAITGAQLMARGRSDISLYDTIIRSYRASGLLP
ncbi:TetR/AcrR family transcriptional regulator [Sphingobium terrigena]|uniref:TetR/AcrR family transcriptional regulator n=1 Tax=Sphingobium terrigena TaxID=2304063 RepID=A0A418YYH0_9SPHN|nr:TetR/AcrR family transcriptional regulator [Sphingobium terrigena]RJG57889.1 TetR/AcrR family transcriptional regulator [Sphingobium terrigena]